MILREVNLTGVEESQDLDFIRELISKAFWAWYALNTERKITTIRWWVIRKTVYVKDLSGVFELLFGPPTSTTLNHG